MSSGQRKNWIYCIRGLAIIAVVVCHQQGVLHESEYIQLVSLYSVTTLVFLMGLTKALSIRSHSQEIGRSIAGYTVRSMVPVLLAYAFANSVYLYIAIGRVDLVECWHTMLTFSTSGPFYYIRYYIILSVLAPLLYTLSRRILLSGQSRVRRYALAFLYIFALWMIGYYTTWSFNVLASSYLSIYTVGLCVGVLLMERPADVNKKLLLGFGAVCLVGGFILTYFFYMANVAGNEHYSEGLNYFFPKLQINPPNPAIILYAAGVVICAYFVFTRLERMNWKLLWKPFYLLGKYSLDIFIWHLFVRDQVTYHIYRWDIAINSLIFKNALYYSIMFALPILYRWLLNQARAMVYAEMKKAR